MSILIIIESRGKIKSIEHYLGSKYKVKASYGHVMDLHPKKMSVDLEHDFKPEYFVLADAPTIPNPLNATNFTELFTQIFSQASIVVASLGGIMLIIAGILFLLSAGNPQRMETAKKALTYAIFGIAIALIAETLVVIVKNIVGVKNP